VIFAMTSTNPIGVFDSGVGGLSVLKEIRALMPAEDLAYVADSAHVPYGDKSDEFIRARSEFLTGFLLERGAKAIVVACNTATAAAVGHLRTRFAVPIVAMEPAVKPAVAATRNRTVGVLATTGTLASARFSALLSRFGNGTQVITQPCPGLVEQVELGDLEGPLTRALLERYSAPLMRAGCDTVILGCTHYPFLRPLLATILGPDVAIIDTGAAVAAQLQRSLASAGLLNTSSQVGRECFWTSAGTGGLSQTLCRLWPGASPAQALLEPVPAEQ
jgi:glutamate racemase